MNMSRGQLAEMDMSGLNLALAEATCLGSRVDTTAASLSLELGALTLAPDGTAKENYRVRLTFTGVSRVAASLRAQKWDDIEARVLPLQLAGLDEAIQSFGGGRLHGWEFIDLDDSGWALWSELLSFDTTVGAGEHVSAHVLEFSQEEGVDPRELDVRVWFDNLTIHDAADNEIPLPEFIEGGARWWQAHDAGDPQTLGSGIVAQI